jgi:hypothetical protein
VTFADRLNAHPARPWWHGHCPADSGRCRVVVNDLRRLIDRLRSGLDKDKEACAPSAGRCAVRPRPLPCRPCPSCPPCPTAAGAPKAHPIYAVDPIGRIRPAADQSTITLPPRVIENYPRITNLGTLLDVLA